MEGGDQGRRWLSVSSAEGRRRCHRSGGKVSWVEAKMARRWFLVVWMERSAERERCWSGVAKVTEMSFSLKRSRRGWEDSLSMFMCVIGWLCFL